MSRGRGHPFSPHEIQWDETKAGRLWDFYGDSPSHASTYFGEAMGAHFARVLKRKRLLLKNKIRILDFSCGTGAIISAVLQFVPFDAEIKGIDPSSKSVAKANSRNSGDSRFLGAYQLEYCKNLEPGETDLVLLTEVVEHLDSCQLTNILGECYRALAPGGHLVVTTPNAEDLNKSKVLCPECGCIFHRWQHRTSWDSESLRKLFLQNGLGSVRVERVTWGNELIHWTFVLLRRKHTGLLAIGRK